MSTTKKTTTTTTTKIDMNTTRASSLLEIEKLSMKEENIDVSSSDYTSTTHSTMGRSSMDLSCTDSSSSDDDESCLRKSQHTEAGGDRPVKCSKQNIALDSLLSRSKNNTNTMNRDSNVSSLRSLPETAADEPTMTLRSSLARSKSCPESKTTRTQHPANNNKKNKFFFKGIGRKESPVVALERNVSFGDVEVREFERVLDVHPSCSCGPSLGIGWQFESKEGMSLVQWEQYRLRVKRVKKGKKMMKNFLYCSSQSIADNDSSPNNSSSSSSNHKLEELVLSKEKREKWARALGYSEGAIGSNIKKIMKVKRSRVKSVSDLSGILACMENQFVFGNR